jgi:hypothetical protein
MKQLLVTPLAIALATALSFTAVAEDAKPAAPAAPAAAAPAAPAAPAKPAEPAKPAAKKPAAPKTEVKAEVTGKLEVKKFKNKKGVEMDGLVLTVATAKAADGKALDNLKGKTLRVAGKKGGNTKSFAGKDVTINGTIFNNRRLSVDTIK